MAVSKLNPVAGGGIKLVQRGQATSSGNTTITAIDTTKAFIRSFSEGASGTVATNSVMKSISNSAGNMPSGGSDLGAGTSVSQGSNGQWSIPFSGGTMDATTKQMGAYIVNSTTITATGACRWEVVEFA